MTRLILLAVVLTYRLIPARVRGRACAAIGRPKPTSHLALAGLRAGNTRSFFTAVSSWLDDPWKGPSW